MFFIAVQTCISSCLEGEGFQPVTSKRKLLILLNLVDSYIYISLEYKTEGKHNQLAYPIL